MNCTDINANFVFSAPYSLSIKALTIYGASLSSVPVIAVTDITLLYGASLSATSITSTHLTMSSARDLANTPSGNPTTTLQLTPGGTMTVVNMTVFSIASLQVCTCLYMKCVYALCCYGNACLRNSVSCLISLLVVFARRTFDEIRCCLMPIDRIVACKACPALALQLAYGSLDIRY